MNVSMLNKIPKMHLIQNKIIHFMLKDGTIHSAPAIKIPPKYFYYHSFIFFIKAEPTKLTINILSKVMPHGTVNISSVLLSIKFLAFAEIQTLNVILITACTQI